MEGLAVELQDVMVVTRTRSGVEGIKNETKSKKSEVEDRETAVKRSLVIRPGTII